MARLVGTDTARFEIHASIVFQLGESLISDDVQALVELVKNAYDADASYAKVTVDTDASLGPEYAYPGARGYILVEDNGVGMGLDAVQRGWLTISNTLKRDFKERGGITAKGRTPLGDKGLGRLGAQRLGHNVEIFTRPETEDVEHHIAFSWRDFIGEEVLSAVPVRLDHVTPPRLKRGTKLVISDLKDADAWRGDSVARLTQQLSTMISPFKEVQDFRVVVAVDGRRLELAEITEALRETAQIRYRIHFDGRVFRVIGKARLDYCRPQKRAPDRALYRTLVEADGGERFLGFLLGQKKAEQLALRKSDEEGWFVEYEFRRNLDDFDSLALYNGNVANPGPFHGEVDFIGLEYGDAPSKDVFSRSSEYRKFVRELSGIRVYRDGFAVRVDRDWLQLGQQWTRARSYYGLRPANTLGYIALTAGDNAVLEETTDREGFKVTPYYNNFHEMLRQFVRFCLDAQTFLRRGWRQFQKDHGRVAAGVESEATPESLSLSIRESLARAEHHRRSLEATARELESVARGGEERLRKIDAASPESSPKLRELAAEVGRLQRSVGEAREVIHQIECYLTELSGREAASTVLGDQIEELREQLSLVYETVSLGLTAEALSHEIHNIADQLAARTRDVSRYLDSQAAVQPKLVSYVEYVHTTVAALRKQLSHFDPSLRYVRERREHIDLAGFFKEITGYYRPRLKTRGIELRIEHVKAAGFALRMSKGKLHQVVDNLFLNSEYWLQEDIRLGHIDRGIVTVEIEKPYVRVSDNGRGVHPSVEVSLFEPFVTMKGKEKGRGLGLFVVRQLLDSDGCAISLLPIRNKHERLYVFEIDFTRRLDSSV